MAGQGIYQVPGHIGHLLHLGVRGTRPSKLPKVEEVSPLPGVAANHDNRFSTVRPHCSSLLGRGTHFQQFEITTFGPFAGNLPLTIDEAVRACPHPGIKETRKNNRNLLAELALGVIAVTCGLLAEAEQTVTDQLMGYPSVTGELKGDKPMLQNGLMVFVPPDKVSRLVIRQRLRLVSHSGSRFD